MKYAEAIVFRGPGKPLELTSFPLPELRPGEGLVKIEYCTICGSDLHTITGKRSTPVPTILGHEILGVLIEATEGLCDITGCPLQVGDRVSWSVCASCGQCYYCLAGLPQKCERLFKYGHQPIDQRQPLSGGLATHCHLSAGSAIVKVPENLDKRVACPANCATATVAGAFRIAGGCAGKSVLIVGAGMLGLTATAMAQFQGATQIIILESQPQRAKTAEIFGATSIGADQIGNLTDGRGVDLAFDMSGSPEAIETALNQLRIGGQLVLVGSVFPAKPVLLDAEMVVRRLLRIDGLHNYLPEDLSKAIEFLDQTQMRFPFADLVEAEFRLSEINRAIEESSQQKFIRFAIRPK